MSTSYVLIVFALVIVLMIVLISKCKVNAAMGILLSAFILPWGHPGRTSRGPSTAVSPVPLKVWPS